MNQEEKKILFLELFEPLRDSLYRFSRAMTKNSDDAMDLAQETTLQAFDNFEKLRSPKAFQSFLFTIASRIHKRSNWRKRFFFSFSKAEDYQKAAENIPDKFSNSDSKYDLEALYKAINKLSNEKKEALILFEINGLSLEEIKEIQGVSLSAVKSRVQRARKFLAEELGVDDDREPLKNEKSEEDFDAYLKLSLIGNLTHYENF